MWFFNVHHLIRKRIWLQFWVISCSIFYLRILFWLIQSIILYYIYLTTVTCTLVSVVGPWIQPVFKQLTSIWCSSWPSKGSLTTVLMEFIGSLSVLSEIKNKLHWQVTNELSCKEKVNYCDIKVSFLIVQLVSVRSLEWTNCFALNSCWCWGNYGRVHY